MDHFAVVTLSGFFHSDQKKKPDFEFREYAMFRRNLHQTNGLWEPKLTNFHKEMFARGNAFLLTSISLYKLACFFVYIFEKHE